ncbi:MAG: ABC transporter substrate-binding protein [Planctomycetota bacterium]|jgi:peptide/nickel transport system substrate-binding protein
MGGEVILNLIKIGLILLVALFLLLSIWQADELEERVLNLEAAVNEARTELGERIDELAERGVPTVAVDRGPEGKERAKGDPRTLPYWPTTDNILADLTDEPRPPEGAPRGGIIHYYTASNPRTLNSHVDNEAELQERICGPVYEYIAPQSTHNPDEHVPGLCNRVTVNEDFTLFTCYVRKGVFWHKPFLKPAEKRGRFAWLDKLPPQEVTAGDIKFNFDLIMNPQSECGPERSFLLDIESVEVLDRYTVRIKWKRSRYYNKGTTLNLLMIYPKFIFERDENGKPLAPELVAPTFPQHWFNNKMCGTGPFQFAGFEPNQIIRLRRNPNWWNPARPVIDGINLRIVEERATQLAMFKKGDIDVLWANPQDYRSEVLEGGTGSIKERVAKGEVNVKKWEAFVYYFVGWNLRLPQLREREVRHALAHLYPKDRVIRDINIGLAKPAVGPVHPWQNFFDQSLPEFSYDAEKAAQILEQAGWKIGSQGVREKVIEGKPVQLRINLLYPASSTTARDITLLYQKSAEAAGILLEPYPREWTVMTKMLDDKAFDACMLGWGNSWDSDPSQIWHSDSAKAAKGSNMVSYMNPEIDAVIEGLKVTFDPNKRTELWRKFQQIIVHDQPYCFTYIPIRPWFINNRLGNQFLAKLRPQDWFLPWFVKKPK